MDAFEAYQLFLALHQHFYQKSYDYFKYNGKVRVKYEKFLERKDKYMFHRLGKHPDPKGLIVSNILMNQKKVWVTDLFNDDADENYKKWTKINQSITYIFKEELKNLAEVFDNNFIVKDGQHPLLLKKYLRDEVSFQTLVILDIVVGYTKHWNKQISDIIVWPEIYQKMMKYRPFMSVNIPKFRQIILDSYQK